MMERISISRDLGGASFAAVRTALDCMGKSRNMGEAPQFAMMQEGKFICTDGVCLGIATLPEDIYSNGFYVPVTNLKAQVDLCRVSDSLPVDFPNIKAFLGGIKKDKDQKKVYLGTSRSDQFVSAAYANVIRKMGVDFAIDYKLFKKFSDLDFVVIREDGSPLVFIGERVEVYVMPLLAQKD